MAVIDEEQAKVLQGAFEVASRKVKQQTTLKSGGAGAENEYSDTYQALARVNLAPQIRKKYR